MTCKCIKADPLGWLEVGKTYSLYKKCNVYMVEGMGFAVSPESFDEMLKWQKLSITPRRIPLSEPIPSMPFPSRTARSRLTFELSRQTGLRRKPKGKLS